MSYSFCLIFSSFPSSMSSSSCFTLFTCFFMTSNKLMLQRRVQFYQSHLSLTSFMLAAFSFRCRKGFVSMLIILFYNQPIIYSLHCCVVGGLSIFYLIHLIYYLISMIALQVAIPNIIVSSIRITIGIQSNTGLDGSKKPAPKQSRHKLTATALLKRGRLHLSSTYGFFTIIKIPSNDNGMHIINGVKANGLKNAMRKHVTALQIAEKVQKREDIVYFSKAFLKQPNDRGYWPEAIKQPMRRIEQSAPVTIPTMELRSRSKYLKLIASTKISPQANSIIPQNVKVPNVLLQAFAKTVLLLYSFFLEIALRMNPIAKGTAMTPRKILIDQSEFLLASWALANGGNAYSSQPYYWERNRVVAPSVSLRGRSWSKVGVISERVYWRRATSWKIAMLSKATSLAPRQPSKNRRSAAAASTYETQFTPCDSLQVTSEKYTRAKLFSVASK